MNREPNPVLSSIISQYKNKGIFLLDFSNPTIKAFYNDQLDLAGIQEEEFPAFYNNVNTFDIKSNNPDLLSFGAKQNIFPVHGITSINSHNNIEYEASAISSTPKIATNITQTLGFFNVDGEKLGPTSFMKTYNQGNDSQIHARATLNKNSSKEEVILIYTFTQTIDAQTVPAAEIVSTVSYPDEITNLKPTNVLGNNQIKICLTRVSNDCDYKNTYPGAGQVMVPIEGSIKYFGPIDTAGGKPVNANASIYLIRVSSGGSPIQPADGFNFFNAAGTNISGNILSWNLDWLKFNSVDFASGDQVYYIFKVSVQVAGDPVTGFITNAPNSVAPGQTIRNTFAIPSMYILYGCLGAHTQIMMATGTERAIEDIKEGDKVQSKSGKLLYVESVTKGKEAACLKIAFMDVKGSVEEIITSPGHPFDGREGVLLAKELKKGDLLSGPSGWSKITDIQVIKEEINVYNLHLGTREDKALELLANGAFMIANQLYVGDSVQQRIANEKYRIKTKSILQELPEEWKRDFENYHQKLNSNRQ